MKLISFIIILSTFFSFSFSQTASEFNVARVKSQPTTMEGNEEPGFKARYVFLSLLIPGAGELFMGESKMAKIFFGTDLLLWAGYFGTQAYVDVLGNDFRTFATVHADVDASDKEEQYWIEIGSAGNIYEYNEQKRVDRRLNETLPENDKFSWQWDSQQNREKYNELRVKQHDWERRATFLISGLILNRLISAIDVVRLIRKDEKSEKKQKSSLYFNYLDDVRHGETMSLNLQMRW